jgi:hypothetical protein
MPRRFTKTPDGDESEGDVPKVGEARRRKYGDIRKSNLM